jgi:photosystem II stability/assembly factor-like uncharacterized protein
MFESWNIVAQRDFSIHSFFVCTDNTIYAVMDDSTNTYVMKNINGEGNWEKVQKIIRVFGGRTSRHYKLIFTTSNVGFLLNPIGGRSVLYKSEDNGANWIIERVNNNFRSVHFINNQIGFFTGNQRIFHGNIGYMFSTIDGGQNLSPNIVSNGFISNITFPTEFVGFGLMNWLEIYKTVDQGENWSTVYENNPDSTGYSFFGTDISHIDEQKIYAIGEGFWGENETHGQAILHSDNSGETWNMIWKDSGNECYLHSIHIVDNTIWTVGDCGFIVKSINQDSFAIVDAGTDLPLNDVFFADAKHGWIAGGYIGDEAVQSILLLTGDSGKSWKEIQFDQYLINDMYFVDSLHGWVGGEDSSDQGIILETFDGGESWTAQLEGLSAPLNALHFKDGYGWAVGERGLVLRTEDGSTWIDENTGKTYPNKFSLSQNYPNPFNPSTKIKFALPKADKVKIELYNTLGQREETILNRKMKAGNYDIEFNAENLSSGVYFYRLQAGEFQDAKKMILLK